MAEPPLRPYTSRMRLALSIARGLAAAHGDADVTTTRLALGLLREGQNLAVAAILHAAVPLRVVDGELRGGWEPPGGPWPDGVAVPLPPGGGRARGRARAESHLRGNQYVGSEPLLLTILREPSSPAAQAFARHGTLLARCE